MTNLPHARKQAQYGPISEICIPSIVHTYRSARPCPTLYPSDSSRKNVVSLTSSSSGCLPSFEESSFASRSAIGTSSIRSRSRHDALRRWAWGSERLKGELGASNDIAADGGYAGVAERVEGRNELIEGGKGVVVSSHGHVFCVRWLVRFVVCLSFGGEGVVDGCQRPSP